ncbi:hypothetical protein [Pararhodobacter sp.]|uniref:hypothetical protein n=1 Tax=Pararhodobacter sp. TaxID=2127056 RepID=UPI002B001FBB|nr:hypothetical protein [Pararhodobacter sp.]
MTRFTPIRFKSTTAVAALLLPVLSFAATAQTSGFAIEVGPSADGYSPVRVSAHVFGQATDPASTFVRGCQGHVLPEAAGTIFEVTARMETLAFTGAGDGLVSMVLGTPDGLYRCALADSQGLAVSNLAGVEPGRYMIWLGGAEGSSIDARLIASDLPVSPLELFGLNVAELGDPRTGRFVFSATADTGRQELAMGATLMAQSEMRPLSPDYCPGYSQFDAADAVLTLDQASDRFSVFAMSERDLTMAVVRPDGSVLCNDDMYDLNPAVTIDRAEAGDYQIFVGGYSQGGTGRFDLFASEGGPAFSNAVLDLNATPRAGSGVFDIDAAGQGQLLATGPVVANDSMELLPTGGYCPGFTDISAPDFVLTLDDTQPMISLYARSQTDLVMAVRAPDGTWLCNDDNMQLNPGLSFESAQPGDYLIFVGAYNPGAMGTYNLYASMGSPNWQATQADGMIAPASLNATAAPAVGQIEFGPGTRIDPRIIFDIQPSQTEAFGIGQGCAGFITPSQPDLVITAQPGLPQLMVYMVSEADGTLVISGPDGQLYCNDDFEQLNPGVMIPNAPAGDYAVFAGTYSGTGGMATLGVTIAAPLWVMDREH